MDGTFAGHTILVVADHVVATGEKYNGFTFDVNSCKVVGNEAYATGQLTNTLGEEADFSLTVDFQNEEPDGSAASGATIATAAYQVFHLPPGQSVTAGAVGTITPGTATGPRFGCSEYNLIAADSRQHTPY